MELSMLRGRARGVLSVLAAFVLAGAIVTSSAPQSAQAGVHIPAGCHDDFRAAWGSGQNCSLGVPYVNYGAVVGGLQRVLNAKGFAAGIVDCSFGTNTRGATIRLQANKGLTQDGVAGPNTLSAAQSYLAFSFIDGNGSSHWNVGSDADRFLQYGGYWLVRSNAQGQFVLMYEYAPGTPCVM